MKKSVRLALSLFFMVGIFLLFVPNNAQAMNRDSIGWGEWTDGSSINVSNLMESQPKWLQLISNDGVIMTEAGEICHPFRGGQFGWIGEIREYQNNRWIMIPTTNGWVPSVEGAFMSCAQAPEAGIYALFGYYVRPVGDVNPNSPDDFDCSTLEWDVHMEHVAGITLRFFGTVTGLPEGTQIDMTIDSSQSDPNTIGGSTSDNVAVDGSYDVVPLIFAPAVNHIFVDYSVPEYGCTYSFDHGF